MRAPRQWLREEISEFAEACRLLAELPGLVWMTLKYLPLILPLFLTDEEMDQHGP